MTPLGRGYSFVMYLAKADATYTVPFPLLHSDDLRVFAGDVGDAVEQQYEYTGPTEIRLISAVPEGILVTARRFTPRDDLLVHVQNGAMLPAADLNTISKQLLYVMQEQIDFGTYGGSGLPGGGAGWPGSGGSTDLNIQQIIDQLMQSQIMQLLVSRIDDVDDSAETLLEELIRSDQLFDSRRQLDGRLAFAETTLTALTDDTGSVAQQVTELFAKFDDAAAQFLEVNQALATETEARTTSVTQLSAAIGETQAGVSEVRRAIADESAARAEDVSTVSAEAAGKSLQIEERLEALVTGAADPSDEPLWSANWSVRINAGDIGGTPVIAGIGLGVDSETGSNFVVMADRFGIVSPTYTSTGGVQQMKYPFVVGTVGGVSTVGITGQLIVDGSVTADKIKVNSLSALTANMGEVNGGTFRTYQLNAAGAIIDPLEFRVELTNKPGDAYPLWVGAGVKNWNNAVFVVDRSGNAKFSGTVTAQNITDVLQRTAVVQWSGDIVTGATSTFSLQGPVRLGESHVAVMNFAVDLFNTFNNQKEGVTLDIQYLNGTTWVSIFSQWFWLPGAARGSFAIAAVSPPLSGPAQFRVVASNNTPDAAVHLYNVTGYIIGVR